MFTRALWVLSVAGVVLGCGTSGPTLDEREYANGSHHSYRRIYEGHEVAKVGCKHTWQTGCIAGQIVVSPRIYLEGEEYFDVETMGKHLKELIKVKDEAGALVDASTYELALDPQITNENFKRGFAVYLKGQPSRDGKVAHDGSFTFDSLQPGTYEVRVQRQFKLKLTSLVAKTNSETQQVEQTEQQNAYCVTIYADDYRVEVEEDKGVGLNFDNFNLHVVDQECSENQSGLAVTR